ncbi:hypothetical protein PAXINDRAFT_85394, partial [Paxillus involutus ATCC 200175]
MIGPDVKVGSTFGSLEEAQLAIYAREERHGHCWRRGQSKKVKNTSELKRLILRCNHYANYIPSHSPSIDPSDHRTGKTIKTNCTVHANLNRITGASMWQVTLLDWDHNHPPEIPPGGIVARPPSKEQRNIVTEYSGSTAFRREHVNAILKNNFPTHPLEPRQVSNMINNARRQARVEVKSLGGDVMAI